MMKLAIIPVLIAVLLASGCTQAPPEPGDGNQSLPGDVLPGNESGPPEESYLSTIVSSPGKNWYCGSFNINASLAGGLRISKTIEAASSAGFSFIGLTINHSQAKASEYLDSCEQASETGFLCIPGLVAGSCEGQLVAIGIRQNIESNQTLEEAIDQVHSLGGIAYITHPMQKKNCSEWKRWDIASWDGLAVTSPMTQRRQDSEKAIEKWHAFLNNGYRRYAFGETSTKPFQSRHELRDMIDSSYQCLYIEGDLTEDSVKNALRTGSFYVTNGPIISFEVNSRRIGETINASYGEEVDITLDVNSMETFNRVRIIRNGEVIHEIGKSLNRVSINITSTVVRDTWFSAEVWGGDYTPQYHDFVHAISNPIWVAVPELNPDQTLSYAPSST